MKSIGMTLVAASLLVCSFTTQAKSDGTAPSPKQDPIVQHLDLSNDQVMKIQKLHDDLENNIGKIPVNSIKEGALIDMFHAGKWDDGIVKKQLTAIGNIQQQARYYRVKYYFDVSRVLTPAQREKFKSEVSDVLNK